MEHTNTVIVGSSAAGMACAARLKKAGIDFRLLEKQKHVAHAWRNHYDRLHLHTNKNSSELPFVKYPKGTPKYPPRIQVVQYFENYASKIGLEPEFETEVQRIQKSDDHWKTTTNKGQILSKNVIICTGNTNIPRMVEKPGLDQFPGKVIHSSAYKNGSEFKDKDVLVIGFGNSACEIAICLHEHSARPALSVRSEVNVLPRDVLGIPVLQIGIWQSALSPKVADIINGPLLKILIGDIRKYGLKKLPYGPIQQIVNHHQIPLLDIGTMKHIKNGNIRVFGDVKNIKKNNIIFEDGREDQFDAIIMGTGYETGIDRFLDMDASRFDDIRLPIKDRKHFGKDSLYFCGFFVSPTGMIREMKIESDQIVKDILKQLN